VPLTTLHRSKAEGGWGLDDVRVKCKVLLFTGIERAKQRSGSSTSALFSTWKVVAPVANPPPNLARVFVWSHLSQYFMDMAYIPPMGITEMVKEYKRRLRATLQIMEENASPRPTPRILRHFPTIPWTTVWRNLHTSGLADTALSTWYRIVHDIVLTRQRLAAHQIVATVQCVVCGGVDSLLHRLVLCMAGAVLWRWTRGRLACFLRVDHSVIPDEWLLRPVYHFWPPKKRCSHLDFGAICVLQTAHAAEAVPI
jgi:hypothetical protein